MIKERSILQIQGDRKHIGQIVCTFVILDMFDIFCTLLTLLTPLSVSDRQTFRFHPRMVDACVHEVSRGHSFSKPSSLLSKCVCVCCVVFESGGFRASIKARASTLSHSSLGVLV
jgi:hypothetical protein